MNKLNLGIILIALFSTVETFAATADDYYCTDFSALINYFDVSYKTCADGTVQKDVGVCNVSTSCIFITDDIKKELKMFYPKRDIATMTFEEKKEFFDKRRPVYGSQWVPSLLTCKGEMVKAIGVAVCPIPEKCKGDLFFKSEKVMFNQTESEEVVKRWTKDASGATHEQYFPVQYTPTTPTTPPAPAEGAVKGTN